MKTRKKLITWFLILVMLLSQTGMTAFAENEVPTQTDVVIVEEVTTSEDGGDVADMENTDEVLAEETDADEPSGEDSVTEEGETDEPIAEETTEEATEETTENETITEPDSTEEASTEELSTEEVLPEEETTEEFTTEEMSAEETVMEEETTEESVEELTTEEVLTDETVEDNWNNSGHKAPKLEMKLTSAMTAEKKALNGTARRLGELEESVQYEKNEAVFFASSASYAAEVAKGYGAEVKSFENGIAVIEFEDDVTEIIAMAEDMDVKLPAVYPNYIYTTCDTTEVGISNDMFVTEQDYHDLVNTTDAWEHDSKAGKGIKVAVIDSGIYKAHEDLKSRVSSSSATYSTPYNKGEDNNGHGTHVSGIIAANKDNIYGGAGIAYNASIISIKALEHNPLTDGSRGSTADIIAAINSAVKSGARVINMSLGGEYYDAAFEAAVNTAVAKGVVVVVAAGNESDRLATSIDDASGTYYSPACFENVITVSAANTSESVGLAYFSNYGNGVIDIAAPGTDILSTLPDNEYGRMSGTSQATPMVAAAAAYILSVNPDLSKNKTAATVETVKDILQDSANKAYNSTEKYGAGLLDVGKAVQMAAPSTVNNTELKAPVFKLESTDSLLVKNQVIQDTDTITISSTLGENTDNNIKIYYTTNGKTPTEKEELLYNGAFRIPASGTKTIKAMAVYYGKKSAVSSINIKVNAYVTDFAITPKTKVDSVSSGKSLTLTATDFEPVYATNKKVTWEIIEGNEYATINANNGALKANKNITESDVVITVKATSKDAAGKSVTKEIEIIPTVSALALENKADAKYTLTYPDTKQMEVVTTPADIEVPITYTSSNKKVATVSESGLITPIGAGKTTITAKTADGSNKSVSMAVTVQKAVGSIEVSSKTGEYSIGANKSLQMVAAVTKDATNKKVTWSIKEDTKAATINAKNGALKAAKEVNAVETITVVAAAQDGSGVTGEKQVTIYPSVTTKVLMENGTSYNLATKASGNLTTSVQLYPYTDGYTAKYIGRAKDSGNVNLDNFTYKSSNQKVVTVTEKGLVEAKAAGSAKITITAKDGSKKSVTCSIKVVKPVTSISILSKSGVNFVGKGKSLALGASVNSDATNKKITWTSSNTSVATVNGSGKVTGKSNGVSTAVATITATANDGSGISKSINVIVMPAITDVLLSIDWAGNYKPLEGNSGYFSKSAKTTYYVDQYDELATPFCMMQGDESIYYAWNYVDFSCSNSNVIQIIWVETDEGEVIPVIYAVNKGSATITYKALDGSNKKATLKITVK